MRVTECSNAFVVAWSFVDFLFRFVKTLCRRLGFALEVNLTATCHKLERNWEELSWKAALISYLVGFSDRMAGGNHFQHAFALFLICSVCGLFG